MNDVEQIKERLDVAEVVGGYVPLKQAGRNLKAPCPFHNEKTASFMVSPEKGIWHCFGCQQGGDVISFVMKMEGLEFRGALELLAQRAGIELSSRPGDGEAKRHKERLQTAVSLAVKYFQASLVKNRQALEYAIKQRGLNKKTIQDFQIGYAPDDWNALSGFLLKKGYSAAELRQAGLVGQREGKSTIFDMYRGRLMFTICDAQGSPVGFTGRVLDDGLPKYLNTPQTPLYDKGRILFGLHLAKAAIREHDEVVIVEGNMDVVASHQAGVAQVVAASGTAVTLDQLRALSRMTKNIKICFDADAAGLRATERVIELAQTLGISLSMVNLGSAKDPDELLQQDVNAWRKAIADAAYVVDYLFAQLESEYDLSSATGKRHYSDRLMTTLRRLGDPVEQDHYIKVLAKKVGSDYEVIRDKLKQSEPKAVHSASPRAVEQVAEIVPPSARQALEESVLAINLAYPEVRLSMDDVQATMFTDHQRAQVAEAIKAVDRTTTAVAIAEDLRNLGDYVKILSLRGEELYASLAPADRSFEAFQLVGRLQTYTNKQRKAELSQRLREAEAGGDREAADALYAQYQAMMAADEQ